MGYITQYKEYTALNEKKGDLKKLVGKEEDEELTHKDATTIGRKVAKMEGTNKRKFRGIINFLGASCRIFNEIDRSYNRASKGKKKAKSA